MRNCPFCDKPFVLDQAKPGMTAFRHYSEGCPLHEAGMQFVKLPIETMALMLNTRPIEDALLADLGRAHAQRDDLLEALRTIFEGKPIIHSSGLEWEMLKSDCREIARKAIAKVEEL